MDGAALAAAEARLGALRGQVAAMEQQGGGGAAGGSAALRASLRALRLSVAPATERARALDARRAALRAEVKAAAAANGKLRYQNEMASLSAEGCDPIPIDVVRLQDITRERFREEYQ